MVNTTPVEGRAKITSQQITFECTCGNSRTVNEFHSDNEVVVCTYCQTEYSVYFNNTIRKTARQINKELGYDVSND